MVKKLSAAQKRGMLVLLVGLVLFAGWRWRVSQAAAASTDPGANTSRSVPSEVELIELNAADTSDLQRVSGIGAILARRIVRYRELLGGYTSAEQLLKIPGVSPENFLRIEEQVYVDTTTAAFAAARAAKPQGFYGQSTYPNGNDRGYSALQNRSRESGFSGVADGAGPRAGDGMGEPSNSSPLPVSAAPSPAPVRRILDLNTADSTELVEVSGIGPGTARNIVKYRSLIFYYESLDQLSEVWGVRPENLERMKPYLSVGPTKEAMPHLRINEMTVDEMGRHKYLGFKAARILVAYREMHGPFADFEAVRKVQGVEAERLEKVRGYLVF
jgi:competence ComEA-like helix-hairpin-helix protein